MQTIRIDLEISIKADIQHVWNCLTQRSPEWWSADFYTSDRTKRFVIEAKADGRMYEDYGNDEGLVWGNVIIIDGPRLLEIRGQLSPAFGGPAISFLRLELKEDQGGTLLTLRDTVMGEVDDRNQQELSKGWSMIFGEGFKSFAEATISTQKSA